MMDNKIKAGVKNILGLSGLFLLLASLVSYTFESYGHAWSTSLLFAALVLVLGYMGMQFEAFKRFLHRRSARFGANMILYLVVVLGILITVNYLAEKHRWRWDTTELGLYTLSPQTKKLLAGLEKSIEITAFFPDGAPMGQLTREMLQQYTYESPQVTFRIVDPDKNPVETKAMQAVPAMVFLKCGEREEKYVIDQKPTENQLTNAILKVTREGQKKVYFVDGHGEKSLEDDSSEGLTLLKEALKELNYQVEPLVLVHQPSVPDDAAVVVVCGPEKELLEQEGARLKDYVARGGRLIVQIDPAPAAAMETFLTGYGVLPGEGLVIDTVSQIFGVNFVYAAVMNYASHPINQDFNYITLYPEARPLNTAEELPAGVQVVPLATTSANSWAEKGPLQGEVSFDSEQDVQGPVTLAVAVNVRAESAAGGAPESNNREEDPGNDRLSAGDALSNEAAAVSAAAPSAEPGLPKEINGLMVVFGDSDFVTNKYLTFQGNLSYFLNSVHYLAGEEDLVAISPKQIQNRTLLLTDEQRTSAFWLIVFPPFMVGTAGIMVWLSRRG